MISNSLYSFTNHRTLTLKSFIDVIFHRKNKTSTIIFVGLIKVINPLSMPNQNIFFIPGFL